MALCRAVWMIQARGELGHAGVAPLVHGGRKCFLRSLFGQVEVADQPIRVATIRPQSER